MLKIKIFFVDQPFEVRPKRSIFIHNYNPTLQDIINKIRRSIINDSYIYRDMDNILYFTF